MGNSCRFTPTCSTYMQTALENHGALKGTYLGLKRICRCNPLFDGGIDPVPSKDKL
ncbi:membrane protein insertion efficiency factor YidD [Taylorella equigenitalis]|nr:membrane protein insertion efficiency factor YidD [Taylorella equigenitalis]WEE01183.1 membrane protein insertion efficiency factor YidD [Taylorella equigenitalis]WEE01903.1 membrane protein insertion efficiency factor YidD [Taylorella equigenitalis]WFD80674.1 membrane protein insertion efficiency factor YidD [Taylorella equigenitalis]WFD82152.1 membrane protein insertion efficiency factor YidD [Taylorella equigenitalis]WFD83629.1 membrane protein insertion efficiency factor YidD [Taylorell